MATITEPVDVRRGRRAPIYALFAANAISLSGNQITNLAIPFFVYASTGSALRTGLVAFFQVLPTIAFALIGGGVIDRLGARRTSIAADLLSGVTVALIPLLYHTVGLPFWTLLVLVFAGAALDSPGTTARQTLFPDLIEAAGMNADRANALFQSISRGAFLVGPAVAGLLIAVLDETNVLWLDAASFVVSAGLIAAWIPAPVKVAAAGVAGSAERFIDEMRAGLRFLWRDPLLRVIALIIGFLNFLEAPLTVALPVYATDEFESARALGFLWTSLGAGALAGTILFATIAPRLPRHRTFVIGFFIGGLPFWVLATTPPLLVALAALFISGLASGPLNPILMSIRQERVPQELRGRVFGAYMAIALGAMPVGLLIGGILIDRIGVAATLFGMSGAYLIATGWLLVSPTLRGMERGATETIPA